MLDLSAIDVFYDDPVTGEASVVRRNPALMLGAGRGRQVWIQHGELYDGRGVVLDPGAAPDWVWEAMGRVGADGLRQYGWTRPLRTVRRRKRLGPLRPQGIMHPPEPPMPLPEEDDEALIPEEQAEPDAPEAEDKAFEVEEVLGGNDPRSR